MTELREYDEPKHNDDETRASFDADSHRRDERPDEDEVPFYIPRD